MILAVLALVLALPGVASAAVNVDDGFTSLDTGAWRPVFYTNSMQPSTGSATTVGGVLTMRPSSVRGAATLESVGQVISDLPAHVSFRVRCTGDGYRYVGVYMAGNGLTGNFGTPPPSVTWGLGTTNHYAGFDPGLSATPASGTGAEDPGPTSYVLPQDQWLDGEMWFTEDGISATIADLHQEITCDVRALLSAGGLHLAFGSNDDYGRLGFDLDRVLVEQGPELFGHIRGTVSDSHTGLPLAGIAVRAFLEGADSARLATATVTAADGSYELTTTLAGWYGVVFDDPADGYRDQVFPKSGLPLEWSPALPMDARDDVNGIDARLTSIPWLLANRAQRISGPTAPRPRSPSRVRTSPRPPRSCWRREPASPTRARRLRCAVRIAPRCCSRSGIGSRPDSSPSSPA